MSECPHDRLQAQANPYTLSDEKTGALSARMLTLSVTCGRCGMPFRFEGAYAPVPDTIEDLKAVGSAWISTDGTEVGMRIAPATGPNWATAEPAGTA